jgi:hypothetical protein
LSRLTSQTVESSPCEHTVRQFFIANGYHQPSVEIREWQRCMYALFIVGFMIGGTATVMGSADDDGSPGSPAGTDLGAYLLVCLLSVLVLFGNLLATCVNAVSFNQPTRIHYFLAGGLITDVLIFGMWTHAAA